MWRAAHFTLDRRTHARPDPFRCFLRTKPLRPRPPPAIILAAYDEDEDEDDSLDDDPDLDPPCAECDDDCWIDGECDCPCHDDDLDDPDNDGDDEDDADDLDDEDSDE